MTSRALRLGVVLGDSLVEEKIVDATAPVTLGQSLRCTLSVPVDGVPHEHVLFAVDEGRFVLRKVGGGAEVLAQGARGKLVIGDATILYQEVPKPAPAPKPQLPAVIRGTLADRIDRRLAAIIGGSLAVHVAIAAVAWNRDSEQPLLGEAPQFTEFTPATIEVMLPPDPVKLAPVTQPGVATPAPVAQHTAPIARPPAHVMPIAPPTASTDDAKRLASTLSSEETSGHGVGGMDPHRPGNSLERELEAARHQQVTIGDDGHGTRHQHFGVDQDHPHDLPLGNQQGVQQQQKDEDHAPHGRIPPGGVTTEIKTTLTPQAVLDRINALYLAGLERCYRRELSLDAQLSGKITITFTVGENGRVQDPEAAGSTEKLDHCITSQMGSWHFPEPHDAKGAPTEAAFHVSLALQSS